MRSPYWRIKPEECGARDATVKYTGTKWDLLEGETGEGAK